MKRPRRPRSADSFCCPYGLYHQERLAHPAGCQSAAIMTTFAELFRNRNPVFDSFLAYGLGFIPPYLARGGVYLENTWQARHSRHRGCYVFSTFQDKTANLRWLIGDLTALFCPAKCHHERTTRDDND